VFDGAGHAHFLVGEIDAAVAAVRSAGLELVAVRDIVVVRLHQDRPGELGAVTRALADAGVNIEAVYSDHDHRLVLVVDDEAAAARVVSSWSSR
jgi:hypothetical protein